MNLSSPYILKTNGIFWWVDGDCGYQFVAYFDTKKECLGAYKIKRKYQVICKKNL